MKQTIRIRVMYCPNCEKRIAAALLKLEGVKAARVDYASGHADIESKKALDQEQLQSTLLELGYELSDEQLEAVAGGVTWSCDNHTSTCTGYCHADDW